MFVHQDVSYDIMTDERFAIAIWFALFARVVHLFLRLFRTSFILSWIAITLALRIFMYLTMHHCTSANVLTAAALFFMVTSNHVLQHVRYIFTCNMHTFKELMHFVFALYY